MVTIDAAFIPFIIGLVAGSAAGGLSAFLGYIKQNQEFSNKLFVYGIVTGIITGLGTAILYASDLEAATTATQLTKVILSIVTAVLAADTIRTALWGSITAQKPTGTV